ncbi:MAG: isocitrate lyase/phosphoenolpyruvate mutase family protein [Bacteroidia bacterium]|nr:isocitrate lyase/phosphoenolpyruvate mutase family protein [Bacteroidia bacterium]
MNFKELHKNEAPLIICNVWDVSSAKAAEVAGFQAIATSSGAIASMLGYRDGEEISFEEVLYIVERIISHVKLPLSVDLEAGYSRDPLKIAEYISSLDRLGVVGLNLEDSLWKENRQLVKAEDFAAMLRALSVVLEENRINTFLNIRTDPFLLGHPEPLEESIHRAKIYAAAGADGLFVPCISKEEDIKSLIAATSLPVNVMCMPELADFSELKSWGVSRISMGNFLFNRKAAYLQNLMAEIKTKSSFSPVFQD